MRDRVMSRSQATEKNMKGREGESESVCADIKRFGHEAFVHVVHCSNVTNHVYCSVPNKAVLAHNYGEGGALGRRKEC